MFDGKCLYFSKRLLLFMRPTHTHTLEGAPHQDVSMESTEIQRIRSYFAQIVTISFVGIAAYRGTRASPALALKRKIGIVHFGVGLHNDF